MTLAKKPLSNQLISNRNQIMSEQKAFINNASESTLSSQAQEKRKKVPVLLRVDSDLLNDIDQAAKELGLKRAAFIVSCAARQVKRLKAIGSANN